MTEKDKQILIRVDEAMKAKVQAARIKIAEKEGTIPSTSEIARRALVDYLKKVK